MSSEEAPKPLTVQDAVEIGKKLGLKIGIAPRDHPIYQSGARVRLGLPSAESLTVSPPVPEETEQPDATR